MGRNRLITLLSTDEELAGRIAAALGPAIGQTRRFSTWEAYAAAPSAQADEVLVLDLALAAADCACCRAALAGGRLPPVIVLAGADDGWTAAEFLRAGAEDFIRRQGDAAGVVVATAQRVLSRRNPALPGAVDASSREEDRTGPVSCRWERACDELTTALASERNLLRTLIDQIPDLVYVKDRDSRFIIANAATALLMGASSANDLIGHSDHDFFSKEMADGFRADELVVLGQGHAITNREERALDALGTDRWLLTNKVPLRDEAGTIIGLVGVGRDITLRRRAEDALHQSHAALKERQRIDTEEIHRLRGALQEKPRG